jgi:uridine kinase
MIEGSHGKLLRFWIVLITTLCLYVYASKSTIPADSVIGSDIAGESPSQHSKHISRKPLEDSSKALLMTPATGDAYFIDPIVNRINTETVIIIGIAGGSGSGKTTLSRAIYDAIGGENISYISHDSYYKDLRHLTLAQREKQNFDHPDALDTALLIEHLKALRDKKPVEIPTYDFSTHSRQEETEYLEAKSVVLVEGILIFADPQLIELLDIRIFVDTDDDIRFIRRLQRDTTERGRTVASVIEQYSNTVRPMHLQYVEPSKRNAHIIVPVGLNHVALDLVVSKLKQHLGEFKASPSVPATATCPDDVQVTVK